MGYIEYTTGIQPDTFSADDAYSKVQGTRDGAPFSADWVLARCFEGRVFVANAGSVTSPLTWGDGSISETEHDIVIYVPSGTSIGILEVDVQMETYGTDAIFETMAKIGTYTTLTTAVGSTITPRNMRSDTPFTSNCTIKAACTTVASTGLTGAEFWRDGREKAKNLSTAGAAVSPQPFKYSWNHKQAGVIPVVVGVGACAVYAAAQAGTGFITVTYVEFPTTRLT